MPKACARSTTYTPAPAGDQADELDRAPVYAFWHSHISGLIAAERPDADADLIAHVLLGALPLGDTAQ
ncbi:MAG TPA: hypothetical protein VF070_42090 [Streptosporangiaceae bacterium]